MIFVLVWLNLTCGISCASSSPMSSCYVAILSIWVSDTWGKNMLDGVSLDQLRAFIAAVDEGSFSAGARKLHRAQSAVSELVSNLEAQIGVILFDRSERYPKLTPAGVQLIADARRVVANVDLLKARAKGISGGLESELSAVVDVLFPIEAIAESAMEFRDRFPRTPLRLYVEALGGAYQPVLDGRCGLGVVGPLPVLPA